MHSIQNNNKGWLILDEQCMALFGVNKMKVPIRELVEILNKQKDRIEELVWVTFRSDESVLGGGLGEALCKFLQSLINNNKFLLVCPPFGTTRELIEQITGGKVLVSPPKWLKIIPCGEGAVSEREFTMHEKLIKIVINGIECLICGSPNLLPRSLYGRNHEVAVCINTQQDFGKTLTEHLQTDLIEHSYTPKVWDDIPKDIDDLRNKDPLLFAPSLPDLWEHQCHAIKELEQITTPWKKRKAALISVAMGGGKTRIALEWIFNHLFQNNINRVAWLVNSKSAALQVARDAIVFERYAKGCRIIPHPSWAPQSDNEYKEISIKPYLDPNIPILWIKGYLGKNSSEEILNFLKSGNDDGRGVLLIDEAHHAASASTYKDILDKVKNVPLLIGMTGTPYVTRNNKIGREKVQKIFPKLLCNYSYDKLSKRKVLAKAEIEEVHIVTKNVKNEIFSIVFKKNSDKVIRDFETWMSRLDESNDTKSNSDKFENWNDVIHCLNEMDSDAVRTANEWIKKEKKPRVLIFCRNIQHLENLLERFNGLKENIATGVCSLLKPSECDERIYKFKKGECPILLAVEKLVEGIDLPEADHLIVLRWTTSARLLSQMAGRVLRGPNVSRGKSTAIIRYYLVRFATNKDILWQPDANEYILPIQTIAGALDEKPNKPEKLEIAITGKIEHNRRNIADGKKAPSPSASDWAAKVPELKRINGLNSWEKICAHFKIQVNRASGRVKLKNWAKKKRPNWPSIPETRSEKSQKHSPNSRKNSSSNKSKSSSKRGNKNFQEYHMYINGKRYKGTFDSPSSAIKDFTGWATVSLRQHGFPKATNFIKGKKYFSKGKIHGKKITLQRIK